MLSALFLLSLVSLAVLQGCSATSPARAAPGAGDVTIDDSRVFPESITSLSDGTLFAGSIKGIIYRAPARETHARPWILPSAENGLLAVLGVLADARTNTLWLCSVPTPLAGPVPAGATSSLMSFNLKTGAHKATFPFPPPASACNDITIGPDGAVYASDTPNGRIFRVAKGQQALTLYMEDPKLKGIDGLVFGAKGTLYVNIVTRGELLRIERGADGAPTGITVLTLSQPLGGPDGFRLISGNRFLLAEGNAGRIDEVTIDGDHAQIRVLAEGLTSPPGVTYARGKAYAAEGKIRYLIDPKLKGTDPGAFTLHAISLERP